MSSLMSLMRMEMMTTAIIKANAVAFLGVKDKSKGVFASDYVPVDEVVRRKIVEVSGVEDALLLLKTPGREVSPLREAAFSYYWLSEGDNNTSFFHACATARRWNSDIKILQRPNGDQCTSNPEEIKAIVVNYFSDLFTSRQTLRKEDILPYLNIIPNKVSLQHNEILFAPYMKLPGPSFRLTQIKLQAMMVSQQLSFSTTGRLSNQILFMNAFNFGHFNEANNSTLITLIPIQKGAVKVTDFRPISLIGVMAKVVSKAIVNRLQQFLDEVICPEQCAFLKHRLISDNILIAQELSHFINKSRSQSRIYASLKLDMAKAYDKMEWDFLDLIMKKLGFAELWVDRVLSFVRSARYCIRVNRDISDFFYPTRGLRQGDPLSPYLFIICTEWLSYTLKHYADLGRIEGIQISRRSPSITHLLFADDCLIFMRIHSSTVIAVKNVLQCYETYVVARQLQARSRPVLPEQSDKSQNMQQSDLLKVIVSCWFIWYNKNLALRGKSPFHPRLAYHRRHALLTDYTSNRPGHFLDINMHGLAWKRPPMNVTQINCDGSLCNVTGSGGVGALARDHRGVVLVIRGLHVRSCNDVLDIEGMALKEAFMLDADLRLKNVIFETDCQNLVASINYKTDDMVWH
ncbi:hypothetical protein QQ045_006193 [Rhodiola kirilowii]